MKQKQRNKTRKNSKKTRKVTKKTKKQGRTKKTNKRRRETESEKEKWMKPRRKKGRHREMNNSGENSVFVNKQKILKRKERFRANCPKTHVQGCVDPSARRKRRKEQNTKRREGIFKRSLFKFAKTVSKKEPRKTRKKPSSPQPQTDFWQRPESNPNRGHSYAPKTCQKFHKLVLAREKMGKTSFSKRPQFCSPRPFFAFQTQFGQEFELPKKQICETPKNYSQKFVQHRGDTTGPTQVNEAPQRKIAPKPLVFKCFASYCLLDCASKTPDQKHAQKTKFFSDRKKNDSTTSKMVFLKNPKNPKTVRKLDFRKPQKNRFRATKTVVSKRGGRKWTLGGRKWTLETRFGGPQMNPVAYIYVYTHMDSEICHSRDIKHLWRLLSKVVHVPHNCYRPLVEWCRRRSMGLQEQYRTSYVYCSHPLSTPCFLRKSLLLWGHLEQIFHLSSPSHRSLLARTPQTWHFLRIFHKEISHVSLHNSPFWRVVS